MNRTALVCTAAACCTVLASALLVAGPINPPPGAVSSSLKTLFEVEPRTPISSTTTPGDADSMFRIDKPGSYYLLDDLAGVNAKHAIEIASSGVTLDLGGFDLVGIAGSLDGVSVTATTPRHIVVRNGSVREWGGDGIDLGTAEYCRVERIIATGNSGTGIARGASSLIDQCTASQNITGFLLGVGSTITRCIASANTSHGISASTSATILDTTATSNALNGISAGAGATIAGCTATLNADHGIACGSAGTIRDCHTRDNQNDGIRFSDSCLVTGNHCTGNGAGVGGGAGIHATGSDNRIDANNSIGSTLGLKVDGVTNLIIRNTCSAATPPTWDIALGNHVAPINQAGSNAAAILGNNYTGSLGSTDPNANFSY